MSFDDAIALDRVGDRRYACNVSPDYWIVAGPLLANTRQLAIAR